MLSALLIINFYGYAMESQAKELGFDLELLAVRFKFYPQFRQIKNQYDKQYYEQIINNALQDLRRKRKGVALQSNHVKKQKRAISATSGHKTFYCEECGEDYSDISKFNHRLWHDGSPNYLCDYCKTGYQTDKSLKLHIARILHEEKVKEFNQKQKLSDS